MRSEFINYKIEDLADIKSGKRLPKGHSLVSSKTNFPYIRLVDVSDGLVQQSKMLYLGKETEEKISRYIVKTGDVCLAIVGNTIGMVFQIDKLWNNANLTENAARLTNFKDNVASQYIYYFLTSTLGQNEILSRKVGSAQGKLPMYNIKSLEIPLPSLEEQKKIAHILSTLDDKIELNRKMNETLEAMAQALFKSWFVDFDPVHVKATVTNDAELEKAAAAFGVSKAVLELFPSKLVESEMGRMPKGWERFAIGDITTVIIGKTPPRKEQHWFTTSTDDVKWISIKDMGNSGTYITNTSEYLTSEAIDRFNVKVIPASTVILSFKMTVGRVSITTENMCTNEAIAHFTLDGEHKLSPNYLYCHLKNFNYNLLGSTSSIVTAVNSKIVRTIPTIVPSEEVMQLFNVQVKNIFEQILVTTNEIQTLQHTRDTLLPKLLSGELNVSNINPEQSKEV